MNSLTVNPASVSLHLASVPVNNQHNISISDNGVPASVSPISESVPMILHKMDAGPDETVKTVSVKPFSPGIPRSSPSFLPSEIPGQTVSVGTANNATEAVGVSQPVDGVQDKAETAPGTSPQFDLNFSLGMHFDAAQSCSSNVGSALNQSSVNTSSIMPTATGSVAVVTFPTGPSPASKAQQPGLRSDLPQPPKKPLSPYMRFSKGIWQQVKTAYPGMSVCEVGATIGRIWRELDDANKQRFILEFTNDKARYDTELQGYLRTNGLQASDIIKPRAKKTPKDPSSAKRSKGQSQKNHDTQPNQDLASGSTYRQPTATPQCSTSDPVQQVNYAAQEHGNQEMSSIALPSFSQVWSNPEATTQRDLLAQVVYDSQLHDERDASEIENANQQIVSVFANQRHPAATSVPSAPSSNEPKTPLPKGAPSLVKTETGNWWWPMENNERYLVRNAMKQQPSAGGSSFTEVAVKTEECLQNKAPEALGSTCGGWNDLNGVMVCKSSVANNVWIGQQPVGTTQVAHSTNEEKGSAVDAEKLFLRGALVEKTQEVVQLMRELEQAYGLIHQLKQQNDFFHQWCQEQRNSQAE